MFKKKRETIVAVFNHYYDEDISTERLLAMTADTCDCDVSDVCEAIVETLEEDKK